MYHYKECGLPNIYLRNGFTLGQHPEYGETVAIDNLEGLHQAIGINIVENSVPIMTGAEFRFLRIELDLSQKALGTLLGIGHQTIANYEKNAPQDIADRFLRIVYTEKVCGNANKIMEGLQRLSQLDREILEQQQVELEESGECWSVAA